MGAKGYVDPPLKLLGGLAPLSPPPPPLPMPMLIIPEKLAIHCLLSSSQSLNDMILQICFIATTEIPLLCLVPQQNNVSTTSLTYQNGLLFAIVTDVSLPDLTGTKAWQTMFAMLHKFFNEIIDNKLKFSDFQTKISDFSQTNNYSPGSSCSKHC